MKRRTFTAAREGTVGEAVASALSITPSRAAELTAAGAVYFKGRRCRDADAPVKEGDPLIAVLEESGQPAAAALDPHALKVLHEDARLIAVDKPPGVLAQPGMSGGVNLIELVSARLGHPAGLVHRLDRETSGVTVFGKTSDATSELAALFRDHKAKKKYLAVVTAQLPDRGEIELPLSRDPSRPGRWRATRKANGIDALTRYEVLQRGRATLVALFPFTGRTHQLRAHLTALGAPIAGDRLYGGDAAAPRCLLHAQTLTLGPLTIEAPMPEDLRTFLER